MILVDKDFADFLKKCARPSSKARWQDFMDENGMTLAHLASATGNLSKDFCSWDLEDITGRSVAHCAAEEGTLPDGFDKWDIRTAIDIAI